MAKSTASGDDFDFEIVNENELSFAKRGRKSQVDPALAQAIDPKDKSAKATVSAQLRSAGKSVGVEVSIRFTTEGVPTVRRSTKSA
jgi:hypothetical protein